MSDAAKSVSDYVRINSSDGFSFVVKREIAIASGTLMMSLDPDAAFKESAENTCTIEYRGVVVAKVLEYLSYKVQYADATSKDNVPDFSERIQTEIALELLMAADFLDA